ncbi:MAG: RluA family pseudouridine synthase [Candidatus Woesebacteria bacterium]|jgi:23S rRNA-/tRNA-specific pseudouridylate synthase
MLSQIKIIYEDQDILLINKPPDLVVNRAQTVAAETVQDWTVQKLLVDFSKKGKKLTVDQVLDQIFANRTAWQALIPPDFDLSYGSPEEIFTQRMGIVHRLDKDTSGILLLAKNPGSLVNLLSQFKKRKVSKTYFCLSHGRFKLETGLIRAPLGRARKDKKKFAVNAEGREAVTDYKVDKYFSSDKLKELVSNLKTQVQGKSKTTISLSLDKIKFFKKNIKVYEQGFSLLHCSPKTGRTHQIRVHLKHLQHPLVGDKTYTGKKRSKLDRLWCPRHFLHAEQLSFTHPRTKQAKTFKAELWPDLKKVLAIFYS